MNIEYLEPEGLSKDVVWTCVWSFGVKDLGSKVWLQGHQQSRLLKPFCL